MRPACECGLVPNLVFGPKGSIRCLENNRMSLGSKVGSKYRERKSNPSISEHLLRSVSCWEKLEGQDRVT
jgi:hypothetical protein